MSVWALQMDVCVWESGGLWWVSFKIHSEAQDNFLLAYEGIGIQDFSTHLKICDQEISSLKILIKQQL